MTLDKSRFQLLQGNEACVEGALTAGMRFYSGYPITPSTEIAERSSVRLPYYGGKFIQMEDEISGIAAALGASVTGVKSMTATSGPGFSLKQENIGYAAIAEIPIVIVDVQRSGPSTGLPTSPSQGDVMQSKWGTHGDHPIIVISPTSVQSTYNEVIRSFNLAEKYRTPVIFLMDEVVGHMREGIELIPANELEIIDRDEKMINGMPYAVGEREYVPKMPSFGKGKSYNITGLFHDSEGFPTNDNKIANDEELRLMKKIEANRGNIIKYETLNTDNCDTLIVCYGGTLRAVKGALEEFEDSDMNVGVLNPITIWPFPEKKLLELSKKVSNILVVEHNYGQILIAVERIAQCNADIHFLGKIDGTTISPQEIVDKIKEVNEDA
ncbi:MAG TPA: 2-oxoacid:acceptor oxidoreductase subunit alpha [Anaerovoracaceae bacterium]|nr:2-oxoacid:acceptor oxidoreductase subunit alpha [Anaerovoracaceae bacterium]